VILNPSKLVADIRSAPSHSGSKESAQADLRSPAGTEYLLVCEANAESLAHGSWQFTLEQADGTPVFTADDTDMGDLNRLTLLAAVRGLESIDGPSNVTLLSNNRYLIRSLSDSLPRWRQTNFVWEHFGRRIDVQHADLWRRIDHALSIHRVEAVLISSRLVSRGARNANPVGARDAKQLRIDPPQSALPAPRSRRVARPSGEPRRQDRLRQWLIGSAADESDSVRQRLIDTNLVNTNLVPSS
jgi:ribonuclease HI